MSNRLVFNLFIFSDHLDLILHTFYSSPCLMLSVVLIASVMCYLFSSAYLSSVLFLLPRSYELNSKAYGYCCSVTSPLYLHGLNNKYVFKHYSVAAASYYYYYYYYYYYSCALTEHHNIKAYWRSGIIAPLILCPRH